MRGCIYMTSGLHGASTQSWGLVKSDRAFLSEVFFEKHLQLLLGSGGGSTISVAWEVSSWDPKYVLGMLGPLRVTQCHEKPCVGVCYVYEKMFIRVPSMKHSEPLLFFIYKKASRSGGDFFKGRRKWTNRSSDPLSQITPVDLAFFTYFINPNP